MSWELPIYFGFTTTYTTDDGEPDDGQYWVLYVRAFRVCQVRLATSCRFDCVELPVDEVWEKLQLGEWKVTWGVKDAKRLHAEFCQIEFERAFPTAKKSGVLAKLWQSVRRLFGMKLTDKEFV